jgi:radical SAM family uncharacterized protein
MMLTNEQLELLLSKVRRPSRYIGGEINSANKPWNSAEVRWCLAFPDVYEIGMSHIGLQIIYSILNGLDGVLADRSFTPWIDMEAAMRETNSPLWGLESLRELRDFDIIGITLPYELTYTNILTILNLAGIPFFASERDEKYPLIIGGGVGAFNPEPVAPFFDAILLGDGEEAVKEITDVYRGWKPLGSARGRQDLLKRLSKIRGVHVPSCPETNCVQKAVIPDLTSASYPKKWVVPFMQTVHDRVGVEIQRGCARGCRFCQAGFIYRPVRQRSSEKIESLSKNGLNSTGHEELSLLSLSAGDYEGLPETLKNIAAATADKWTNINLPSLRVESLTPDTIDVLKRSLHGGFTLAPEAGTERLRMVINKGNTEADLLATIERVFSAGWRQLKLYFMIGLPTETIEDVEAIVDLVNKAYDCGRRIRRDIIITASVSTFVPKPHTPFQWAKQISINETLEKQNIFKERLRRRGIELKWHNAQTSFLEGVFARGDKRLAAAIVEAWDNGARFDAWDENFKFNIWMEAFKKCEISPHEYVERERSTEENLPWDHLYSELDRKFLKEEYSKALSGTPTEDCVNYKCSGCGVCDFKEVKNVVCHSRFRGNDRVLYGDDRPSLPATLIFTYSKTGRMRMLSHLELMQLFRRAFRRAGLPVRYSQGFHPHMKLSLERALKVGEEGENLKGNVELHGEIQDLNNVIDMLNETLPKGVKVITAEAKGPSGC